MVELIGFPVETDELESLKNFVIIACAEIRKMIELISIMLMRWLALSFATEL